ncbi:MAG: ABC transporter substrate-binding protein [Acidimicrobiales bacterium]
MTATSILLGSTQPLTGPAAPGYSEIAPASKALFDAVNASGGIYGRKIVYDYVNDQYNPSITATKTRQLVLQNNIFADFNGLGTPTQLTVQPFLNSQGVPQLFVASGCNCWSLAKYPWSAGWQPPYTDEGKILGTYIKNDLAGKKVGYLYQDDEFGIDGVKGLNQVIPASSIVSRQTYSVTTLTAGLANQVAALKAAGAQVVALYTIPAATALTLLAAAQIGYTPTWVVSSVGSDPPTLAGLLSSFSKGKAPTSLLNGMVTNVYLPSESASSNPWIQDFKAIQAKYDTNNKTWDGNVEYGMAVAYTMVDLLKAAGKNLTRQSLLKALDTMAGAFTGPWDVPLSYSKSDHFGIQGSQIAINHGGSTLMPTGPVYKTTINGPVTTVTNYTPAAPPANLAAG